ncbi:MAG: hypothetical protein K6G33_09115 [Ruminococcus sp.]|uniref:hypothetical protein n=1 Tax=Ruminococcus sp. TaxID=41978 RepID=UPI0025CFC89D|nr:hypothetical protein [Ruminococcus sp.]MCR5600882.1 hypothetical protein [Ruminococcus sp.]
MNNTKNDSGKRSKALTALTLRIVVAVYICYLAFKIASEEDTSMSIVLCRVIGAVFMLAALSFAVYSLYTYRRDIREADIAEDTLNAMEDDAADNNTDDTDKE